MATESTPLGNQSGFAVNPPSLSFGTLEQGSSKSESLTITNLHTYPLNWEIISVDWLDLSVRSGILSPSELRTVSVRVNTSNLPLGVSSDTIMLNFTSTIQTEPGILRVPVSVEVVKPDATKLVQALIESDAIQEQATADIPVQSLDKDKLGFNVYVHAFRDFIASQDTSTPLTIGIYGAS